MITTTLREMSKDIMFEDDSLKVAFGRFRKHLIKRCLYRSGTFTERDEINDQRFKALLFDNAGDDENVIDAALIMFTRVIKGDQKAINLNIRAAVFKIVSEKGGGKAVGFSLYEHHSGLS